jgi:broad specificity phosphatase PhoE
MAPLFTGLAGAAQKPERTLETVMADLAKGGAVILMRHANSPSDQVGSVGMTEGCTLQAGRGLDAKGFFQARFIGEFLSSNRVPIGAAFTSDMCRCWDTARLVAAGAPVAPVPALKSTNASEIDVFKAAVSALVAEKPAENILLVSHSNIVPLYADWTSTEEIPSGVVLIVDPKTWKIKDKLNMDFELSVDGK